MAPPPGAANDPGTRSGRIRETVTPERQALLGDLADIVVAIQRPHPVRVAIDGPDAAGKTTLADELAPLVEQRGRPVIRASVDGFHRPRTQRLARGPESPEGYYLDSFDHAALRRVLLEPLGPGGDGRYRRRVFDHRTDDAVDDPVQTAPADAVLLFDGVFLLRPELLDAWDLRIFVSVPFEETQRRAATRDVAVFGSEEAVRRRYAARYVPGQRLYYAAVEPERSAHVLIDNTDPTHPTLTVRRPLADGLGMPQVVR